MRYLAWTQRFSESEFTSKFHRAFMTFCADWPKNGDDETSGERTKQPAHKNGVSSSYSLCFLVVRLRKTIATLG